MLITYCQKCNMILNSEKLEDSVLCDECAAGKSPTKLLKSRHSDQISRKRLTALSRNQRLKLDKTKPEAGSNDALPRVIDNPEKNDIC